MRIAIIGTGISGMTCGYLLGGDHEVTAYEANSRIGGHTATVDVPLGHRTWPVDTGFIVFNHRTYPHFTRLMDHLGVASQPSVMSFSLQDLRSGLVFCPSSLNALFVQRKNLIRPAFYRMLFDAWRFRRQAPKLLDSADEETTLEAYLRAHRYSAEFIDRFLIPMGAAIWSAGPDAFRGFPARFFAEFFANHGFLNILDQPRWRVIRGGSRSYIGPITRPFANRIRLNRPVVAVNRAADTVTVKTADGGVDDFDHVVIATHSDQALALLADPSESERGILGRIGYQQNQVVLHTDTAVLPPRPAAWASWNYLAPEQPSDRVALTYNMNMLQGLDAPETFCVSLNIGDRIDPSRIIRQFVYSHPIYTPDSLAARRRHAEISGVNRTSFCGAYWGYGFHEDGVNSALAVCRPFGKGLP
ncbi:amine oxidase [Desulfosarcina alkanivorans]|uniref:Amine oxidase n=1 Tax=Desulfosarcina alkanivorans TaxID=571177 RepID=A0A5K7YUC7_9BACT|nr:FAD-dependent oxidoreductase [Desulfosarcina alkanivorans]BBO72035.1 amine oxidase [Desulfosarcina alkanivorans]